MDNNQLNRYVRNIVLKEIGEEGQEKLLNAKVLIVGAGGLGSSSLLYLAASGVGEIGIIDNDKVEISNLQRQIIYKNSDLGQNKARAAKKRLLEFNPDITIQHFEDRLEKSNIDEIIKDFDIVGDGCDNFPTRFLVNEACFNHKKTLVSAATIGFSGHIYCFKPYSDPQEPCFSCLYPQEPSNEAMPRCYEFGVLGSLVGQMGAWQASEIIKEILGIGESLAGQMIIIDALYNEIKKVKIQKEPNCPICSKE